MLCKIFHQFVLGIFLKNISIVTTESKKIFDKESICLLFVRVSLSFDNGPILPLIFFLIFIYLDYLYVSHSRCEKFSSQNLFS